MFNLFHSQGKAQKYLLGGLLVMVAMSMLLYLVPNYDTGQSGTDQATVLQVGKTKWTAQDAERRYQAYAKGRLPEGMMAVYFPQFLEESKQRLAAIEEARRLGIAPSDEEVFEVIAGTPGFAQYFEGGQTGEARGI
ncbi:MAG: SurA N-terminal domain-containing protein [Acidobacteriota bacterium]